MIFEKVAQFLAEQLGIDQSTITMESRIIEDLKADSLDVVELIMALEEEYNMTADEDEVSKLSTVGDVVNMIEKI